MSQDKAIKDFEKKFYDKTRNNWSERETFIAVHGKYTLLEMGDEEEEELPVTKVMLSLLYFFSLAPEAEEVDKNCCFKFSDKFFFDKFIVSKIISIKFKSSQFF